MWRHCGGCGGIPCVRVGLSSWWSPLVGRRVSLEDIAAPALASVKRGVCMCERDLCVCGGDYQRWVNKTKTKTRINFSPFPQHGRRGYYRRWEWVSDRDRHCRKFSKVSIQAPLLTNLSTNFFGGGTSFARLLAWRLSRRKFSPPKKQGRKKRRLLA